MLELEGLNYWAIIVAWLVNVSIGAYWYSPAGFGKKWTKYTSVNILKIPQNEATRIISFVAISGAVQAFTLAIVINSLQPATLLDGLLVGWLLWFGLVAATSVGNTLYQRQGWGLIILNSSYFLAVMTINSFILTAWSY